MGAVCVCVSTVHTLSLSHCLSFPKGSGPFNSCVNRGKSSHYTGIDPLVGTPPAWDAGALTTLLSASRIYSWPCVNISPVLEPLCILPSGVVVSLHAVWDCLYNRHVTGRSWDRHDKTFDKSYQGDLCANTLEQIVCGTCPERENIMTSTVFENCRQT